MHRISYKLNFTDSPRDSIFSPNIESQLEIPRQERLLPIGQHSKDVTQLIDKVRQALGIDVQIPKVIENQKKQELFGLKQDRSQSHSPRRLIKQVALESPPNQGELENTILCKDLNLDSQSNSKDQLKLNICI